MAKRIAYIQNPSPGVDYHRLAIPMSHIAHAGHHVTATNIYKRTDDYDVLVFNRIPWQPYSTLVRLKQNGVKLIMDIDDYWTRPEWHTRRDNQFESEFTTEIIKLLRLADHVWCSTKYLQERVAELGVKNAHYIPNALDYEEKQWERINIERERIAVGWVGATDHHMAFRQLIRPMQRVDTDTVLCGVSQINDYWQYMARIISGGNPKKVRFYKDLPPYQYGVLYNEIDVVLLPAYTDTYSLCKSNLKLLEAGAHKLPVVSNGGAYREVNGKIGIRVEGERDWVKAIKKLHSRRARQEYGEALHEYTKEKYDLKKINQKRIETL